MNKRIYICTLIVVSFLSALSATEKPFEKKSSGVYLGLEGGVAISNHVLLAPAWSKNNNTQFIWYPTGSDSFDTDLGTSKCIGLKIGYHINPVVSVDVTYHYLGEFSSLRGYASNVMASNSFILGDIYLFKKISIQALLFNINLSPDINCGGFVPYISGGAGFASNKIGCLENYNQVSLPDFPPQYDITLCGKRVTCFAWQAGVGAYYAFHNHWRFGMAYRFLDAGKLATCNYATNSVNNTSGTDMAFVAKHPTFNELVLSLTYVF